MKDLSHVSLDEMIAHFIELFIQPTFEDDDLVTNI